MGLHPGWLCVNELVPACFCVYQSQVVIIRLHLSLYTARVPIKNNELAVNVTDCHLLEGVIGQNILSCHIRWFER